MHLKPVWVDPEAARLLLPSGVPHRMVVLLNAASTDTAEQYVKRPTCCANVGYRYEVMGSAVRVGEERGVDLAQELESVLRELYDVPPYRHVIEEPPAGHGTYFLIVEAERRNLTATVSAIRDLQKRYTRLVVILLAGNEALDEAALEGLGLSGCTVLEPLLTEEAEDSGWRLSRSLDHMYANETGKAVQRHAS